MHRPSMACATCDTGLSSRNPHVMSGLVDIQSGTLDVAEDHAPAVQIILKEWLAWLDRVAALSVFNTYPGKE